MRIGTWGDLCDLHDEQTFWSVTVSQIIGGILAVAPDEALAALPGMRAGAEQRERALAVASAILMTTPPLDSAESAVIDQLAGRLGVTTARVIDLARQIGQSVVVDVPDPVQGAWAGRAVKRVATRKPATTADRKRAPRR